MDKIKEIISSRKRVDASEEKRTEEIIKGILNPPEEEVEDDYVHIVSIEPGDFDPESMEPVYQNLEAGNIVIIDLRRAKSRTRMDIDKINEIMVNIRDKYKGDLSAITGAENRVIMTPRGIVIDKKLVVREEMGE